MTLVELIISISLISIVVMFLFRLFVDVRYNDQKVDYERGNQQTRAIIIKMVQDDFLNEGLVGLNSTGSSASQLIVNFTFASGSHGQLKVDNKSVIYQNANGEIEKWILDSTGQYNVRCVTYNKMGFEDNKGDFFAISFRIPLILKTESPNAIDDLEFSYLGKKTDIANPNVFPNSVSLGNYEPRSCG